MAKLLLGNSYRIYAYLLAIALVLELDFAVYKRKQSIVSAFAYVLSGVNASAALTNKNIAGKHKLTVGTLYAKSLRVTVSAVFG